jgi:hypothetical protein
MLLFSRFICLYLYPFLPYENRECQRFGLCMLLKYCTARLYCILFPVRVIKLRDLDSDIVQLAYTVCICTLCSL